jgi:threonine dehydratase
MADAPAQRAALDVEDLRSAAFALEGIAVRTPLLPLDELSARLGHPVRLKAEFFQPIGAFKIRGAWTAITRLDERARNHGVLTHSSGNHGQAVAWVGARLGMRTVIVMPEDSPKVKIEGVRRHGAEIVFCKRTERVRVAREIAEREALVTIPPYEHEDVIAGQATCALEIMEEWADVSEILVPVGGGGLLAGTAAAVLAMRDARRPTAVIGVEPVGAAKLTAALRAGEPVPVDAPSSIADGLLPASIGEIPWGVIKDVVHTAVRVDDAAIAEAVKYLHQSGLRVEPSGAVALAALTSGAHIPSGPVAVIATGGNVDAAVYDRLVAG